MLKKLVIFAVIAMVLVTTVLLTSCEKKGGPEQIGQLVKEIVMKPIEVIETEVKEIEVIEIEVIEIGTN